MLRRLLLALLVIGLALPAMQAKACADPMLAGHDHGMTMPMAMPMPVPMHHTPAQPTPADHHDCIGCIAPLDTDFSRPVRAPEFGAATRLPIGHAALRLLAPSAPEPPPPRFTV